MTDFERKAASAAGGKPQYLESDFCSSPSQFQRAIITSTVHCQHWPLIQKNIFLCHKQLPLQSILRSFKLKTDLISHKRAKLYTGPLWCTLVTNNS